MDSQKSKIFLGYSKTHQKIAEDLIEILKVDKNIVCRPWYESSELSKTFLETLFKEFENCDFAVFIFGPDDIIIKNTLGNHEKYITTRDNVIF